QNERAALVARRVLDGRPPDRLAAARLALFVVVSAIHPGSRPGTTRRIKEQVMKRLMFGIAFLSIVTSSAPTLLGFCGFYVSTADTKLFNKAPQVVLVRDGDRTVITLAHASTGQ